MLSVLAHAVAIAGWLYWSQHAGPATSVGHQRGGLTVRLLALPHELPPATVAQRQSSVPAPPRHMPEPPAPHPTAGHEPRAPEQSSSTTALPASPPPAEPDAAWTQSSATPAPQGAQPAQEAASQAGTTFANMFGPVISRPIGRGRWTTTRITPPTQLDPDAQRQQAMDMVRRQLMERLDLLYRQLQDHPLAGACHVQVSLETQTGQLACDQEADQARIWQALNGLIRTGDTHAAGSNMCVNVAINQVARARCDPLIDHEKGGHEGRPI